MKNSHLHKYVCLKHAAPVAKKEAHEKTFQALHNNDAPAYVSMRNAQYLECHNDSYEPKHSIRSELRGEQTRNGL